MENAIRVKSRPCRFYNSDVGCRNESQCKFLHLPMNKTQCRYFGSRDGCRFGEYCYFSHAQTNEEAHNIKEEVATNQSTVTAKGDTANVDSQECTAKGVDTNGSTVECGSCHHILKRTKCQSFCMILKEHYIAKFREIDSKHVSHLHERALIGTEQMYWCGSCVIVFDKPHLLFQHMAVKSKPDENSVVEVKVHTDWLDKLSGFMAGHDLGVFSSAKLRSEIPTLLADQSVVDDDSLSVASAVLSMGPLLEHHDPISELAEAFGGLKPPSKGKHSGRTNRVAYRNRTRRKPGPTTTKTSLPKYGIKSTKTKMGDEYGDNLTCGFTESDVEELLCQGIKPWDEEAGDALAILNGDFDYLLDQY